MTGIPQALSLSVTFIVTLGVSLSVTITLEFLIALAWCRLTRRPALSILLTGLAANLLTQPALWALLWLLVKPYWAVLLVSEVAIWAAEGLLLAAIPSNHLRLGEALRLSLCMNPLSFGVGLLLPV